MMSMHDIDIFEGRMKEQERTVIEGSFSTQEIWHGDCLYFMRRKMKPKSIDVIVTSCPYNIGAKYEHYNDSLPEKEYLKWMGKVFRQFKRILKDNGSLFLNVGSISKKPWNSIDVALKARKYFVLQNEIIWVKSIGIGNTTYGHFKPVPGERFLNHTFEPIYHFTKTGDVKLDRLSIGVDYVDDTNISRWKSSGGVRCRGNTWFLPYDTIYNKAQRGMHPAIFPAILPEFCIKLHGISKNMIVLDPFMGVGTTLQAARNLGANAIGMEIDEAYVEEARRKLEL